MKKIIALALFLATSIETQTFGYYCDKPYKPEYFKHWIDADGDCLDTRHEALSSTSLIMPKIANCRVVEGKWFDEYSGNYYTNPSDLDYDHIVPLKEAWISGACDWSPKQRQDFANDVEELILVDGDLNKSKGCKTPAEWMPPRTEYQCEYIKRWSKIKKKYNLETNSKEKNALTRISSERC